MIRIWKEGGALERIGVMVGVAALVTCFIDIVDFEALPKTFDRLVIAFPMMALAGALVLGGQRLRHRAEDRRRLRED